MATEQMQAAGAHAALPGWFVRFQDTVGLSLLIFALMGINGFVYAAGVVPDVERPESWGMLRTILFALFFAAGMTTPGIAIRAGAGLAWGHWLRRTFCALVAAWFFLLEVWVGITQRSLNTVRTPADTWLLQVLDLPRLPFSPTVIAITLGLSGAVVAWGVIVGPPPTESLAEVEQKERLKTIKAAAKAERARIVAAGWAGAGRAAFQAITTADAPAEASEDAGANDALEGSDGEPVSGGISGDLSPRKGGRVVRMPRPIAPLQGRVTATQLQGWVRSALGVEITAETALAFVKSMPGSGPTKGVPGAPVSAPKAITLQRAKAKWAAVPERAVSGA